MTIIYFFQKKRLKQYYYLFLENKIFRFIIDFIIFRYIRQKKKIVSVTIRGGLGNQLFQIATTLSYAWKYSLNPSFKKVKKSPSVFNARPVYWDSIFKRIPATRQLPPRLVQYNEKSFLFNTIPPPETIIKNNTQNGINLYGYFQSSRYFNEYRRAIINYLFFISQKEKNILKKKYPVLFSKEFSTISIHIRRDDNIGHADDKKAYYQNLWDTGYYQKAIAFMQEKLSGFKIQFIVFSDDIEWCKLFFKKYFSTLNLIFPQEKDYLDLYLMSLCDHQILANSSFSWWAGYLNENPKKIVIAPKNWFGSYGPSQWNTIYESDWIIIE